VSTLSVSEESLANMRKRFRIVKAEGEVIKGGVKPQEKVLVAGDGIRALTAAVAAKLGELAPADALAEAVIEKAKKELGPTAPEHKTQIVDRTRNGIVHKEFWLDKQKNKDARPQTRWWVEDFRDGKTHWQLVTSLSDARAKIGKVIQHPENLTKPKSAYVQGKPAQGGKKK
jgi:hypothetical protein